MTSATARTQGIHHAGLTVPDLAARDDVAVEFAPEPLGGGPTQHMICTIRGGIRLELIAPVQG